MIDWERVAELQQEVGEEDFAEVLEIFFEEVDEYVASLSGATGDQLASALHFLKGAALNIGMSDFSTLCRDAEGALKADASAMPNIEALKQTLDQSQAELRDMIA